LRCGCAINHRATLAALDVGASGWMSTLGTLAA